MNNTAGFVNFRALAVGLVALLASPLLFAESDAPHWSYEAEEGPTHWGELAEQYRMCSEGVNQSPVDLKADVNADLPELQFDYHSAVASDAYNGHTIQQNIQPGSFLRVPDRGESFELKQFHFHSPSEHQIDGQSFDMELHFVHMNEQGALAVVGVMIEEGDENQVLKKMRSFMPDSAIADGDKPMTIEESNLLPPTRDYYAYSGSLTTPPCSEGVRWVVLKTPIHASAQQIAIFKKRVGQANNRPVQPHNARLILD